MSFPGVVTALPSEARCLTGRGAKPGELIHLQDGVLVQLSGIGSVRAMTAAETLLRAGARGLVSWGTAAGLDPNLSPATLLLPAMVRGADADEYETDLVWRQRMLEVVKDIDRAECGTLAEASEVLHSISRKADLRAKTGAVAADMESAAVARVAAAHGVPFLIVRTIVDSASFVLPRCVMHAMDLDGRWQPRDFITTFFQRPSDWLAVVSLARNFAQARRTLEYVVRRAGTGLLFNTSSL